LGSVGLGHSRSFAAFYLAEPRGRLGCCRLMIGAGKPLLPGALMARFAFGDFCVCRVVYTGVVRGIGLRGPKSFTNGGDGAGRYPWGAFKTAVFGSGGGTTKAGRGGGSVGPGPPNQRGNFWKL